MFLEKTNKYIGNAPYIASADSIIYPSITLYKGRNLPGLPIWMATVNATETYIEDVQTQVLQQYFMLTFSYRLRNFGAKR